MNTAPPSTVDRAGRFLLRDPALAPYRHGLYFAFFNALNWQVATGAPTTLFMQELGADSFQVGLVFAWTYLLTPTQVWATALLPRFGFKTLTMTVWSARSGCVVVPAVLACLAPAGTAPWMIHAMIAAMFVYSLSRSIGTAAITPWVYRWVPLSVQDRYWAMDQVLGAIAVVGALLLYSGLFLVLRPFAAFTVVYSVAAAGAWIAGRLMKKLPDQPRPAAVSLGELGRASWRVVVEPSPFRTHLWLSVICFIATTPLSPFTIFYLKATSGLTISSLLFYTMLGYFGVIAVNWFMHAHVDRVGLRLFFRLSYLLYAVLAAAWLAFLFAGGRWTGMPALLFFFFGAASSCWTSTNLGYLVRILPEAGRALPVSIHAAIITLIGGVSPVLWGLWLKDPRLPQGLSTRGFEIFFAVLLTTSLVLMWRLPPAEPRLAPIEPLLPKGWLLRPFRSVGALVNLFEPSAWKTGPH